MGSACLPAHSKRRFLTKKALFQGAKNSVFDAKSSDFDHKRAEIEEEMLLVS
jgi:hypothetical protein